MREKATKSHIGEGKAGDILRRRIQRLAAGKFEQEQPVLSLSEEKIEIEVLEGQDYTGEFVIEVSNHVPVKGLIYSSNPYMECLTPEFEGEEVRIGFQFHSEGFRVGDIQKGEFCIICNQLEYSLSFVVSIIRPYGNASTGRIRNLSDFIKLGCAGMRPGNRGRGAAIWDPTRAPWRLMDFFTSLIKSSASSSISKSESRVTRKGQAATMS